MMWIKAFAAAVVLLYITSNTDAVAAVNENAEIERALGQQLLHDVLNYKMGNPSAVQEYPLLAYLDKMRNRNGEQVQQQSSYPASHAREEWGEIASIVNGGSSRMEDIDPSSPYFARGEVPSVQAQVPQWPDGTYSIPKPYPNCPFNPFTPNFRWSVGWLLQDTENDGNRYHSSAGPGHLNGHLARDLIVTTFCTKDSTTGDSGTKWPAGSYCVAKYGPCPDGFQEGSVFWDDQDSDNRNTHGGKMPDGKYDTDTRIDYCCRNDAPTSNQIVLPYVMPFYLMRQSSSGCQQVRYMTVTEEYLQWDDENSNNRDSKTGLHPYDGGDPHNHRLYYCYYQFDPNTLRDVAAMMSYTRMW